MGAPVAGATATGSGSGSSATPSSSRALSSIRRVARSASSWRPRISYQRGDSGRLRRIVHTITAPSEPTTSSQRQPSMSRCSPATNFAPMNAASGTPKNPSV